MKESKLTFILSITHDNMYDRQLIEGVSDFTRQRSDCRFTLCHPRRLEKEVAALRPDGVICRLVGKRLAATLSRLRIPTVDLFNHAAAHLTSAVVPDNRLIGRLAAEHFLERRFVRFAFFGYRGIDYSELRRDGFLARLSEAGHDARVFELSTGSRLCRDACTIPSYQDVPLPADGGLSKQLAALEKPVAVFCCHDPRAVAVLGACQRLGITVPDEVSILGVDDDAVYCTFSSPRLSSINPNARTIGFEAARRIFELAVGRQKPTVQVVPPLTVSARESTELYPMKPKWLSDALVYIHRNATRGISACDVFASLGLSHTLVQNAFRTQLGSTVQREIVAVRMDEAKRLLRDSSLPITEIAANCGFSSLHYFSQSFCAMNGISPQDWRTGLSNPKDDRNHITA